MDLSSLLGTILAITSISVGDIMEGGNPLHVLHISSVLIVVPTTMFAAMVATHKRYVKAAFKELKMVFLNPKVDLPETIKMVVDSAILARKDGVLSLEQQFTPSLEDDFAKQAYGLLVDGATAQNIRETMEIQIDELEEYYKGAAHYWITAGEAAPTFGLVGAVMGLMLALALLDDPARMAAGIAGAFTATVTGIMTAYALFGPWGAKLKAKGAEVCKEKIIILEGVLGISNGDNPRVLEAKLLNFLGPDEPKISQFE